MFRVFSGLFQRHPRTRNQSARVRRGTPHSLSALTQRLLPYPLSPVVTCTAHKHRATMAMRLLVATALVAAAWVMPCAAAAHSADVEWCVTSCRVLDGREWAAMGRSNTPCAEELSAWPRPESFRACQDGYTSGAVLACQMGCHGIACSQISTRWRRVAQTQDEVCGPWAGALPRPRMRYKCEEAFEHSFRTGCATGVDLLARLTASNAEAAAAEAESEAATEAAADAAAPAPAEVAAPAPAPAPEPVVEAVKPAVPVPAAKMDAAPPAAEPSVAEAKTESKDDGDAVVSDL